MSILSVSLDSGKNSTWLTLPATGAELNKALLDMGALDKPYSIGDYRTTISVPHEIMRGIIVGSDINAANYLAARLADLPPVQVEKLEAVMDSPQHLTSIAQLIDFADNTDCFVFTPGIGSTEELGRYVLHESGEVDMTEEWKSGIDPEAFGKRIVEVEKGVFTSRGYLQPSGDEWNKIFEKTRLVPLEYRIDNYQMSAVFDVQTEMQRLKDAGVSIDDITEELNYRDRAGDATRWDDNLFEYSGDELSEIEEAWLEPGKYLKNAEMAVEQNYNQIDGRINNEPPRRADLTDGQTHDEIAELAPETLPPKDKPSILEQLKEATEEAAKPSPAPVKKTQDIDL